MAHRLWISDYGLVSGARLVESQGEESHEPHHDETGAIAMTGRSCKVRILRARVDSISQRRVYMDIANVETSRRSRAKTRDGALLHEAASLTCS